MKARIPLLYRPTIIRWNLDAKSKAIMGKRWCEEKRKQFRVLEIMEQGFGKPSKNVRDLVYGGPRHEWADSAESFIMSMALTGEATMKVSE